MLKKKICGFTIYIDQLILKLAKTKCSYSKDRKQKDQKIECLKLLHISEKVI